MDFNIATIPGDGIGPEIVGSAIKVLEKIADKYNHTFNFTSYLAGGCAIDECGISLPTETIKGCLSSDSVLLGAVGGPKWDDPDAEDRPEKALLGLRKELEVFANLRPATIHKSLADACVLRKDIVSEGFDIMIVRELTGGIYFGDRGGGIEDDCNFAYDIEKYNEKEISRVVKLAFEIAMKRSKRLVSIDKANVLATSRLWRKVCSNLSINYKEVTYADMLVDNAAMQLIRKPSQFDVIVTSNMFGDILSDEASQVTGSIGLLPSASLGEGTRGLYEPIHGSAPDIAGQNKANPIATILSAAMMLKYSFNLIDEANDIENAVEKALDNGARTQDIASDGDKIIGTDEMTDKIIQYL